MLLIQLHFRYFQIVLVYLMPRHLLFLGNICPSFSSLVWSSDMLKRWSTQSDWWLTQSFFWFTQVVFIANCGSLSFFNHGCNGFVSILVLVCDLSSLLHREGSIWKFVDMMRMNLQFSYVVSSFRFLYKSEFPLKLSRRMLTWWKFFLKTTCVPLCWIACILLRTVNLPQYLFEQISLDSLKDIHCTNV